MNRAHHRGRYPISLGPLDDAHVLLVLLHQIDMSELLRVTPDLAPRNQRRFLSNEKIRQV